MAEREGFEPPVPFRVRRFSRPEPSTTRPPLRSGSAYQFISVAKPSSRRHRGCHVPPNRPEKAGADSKGHVPDQSCLLDVFWCFVAIERILVLCVQPIASVVAKSKITSIF